jgi:hypothetical protein
MLFIRNKKRMRESNKRIGSDELKRCTVHGKEAVNEDASNEDAPNEDAPYTERRRRTKKARIMLFCNKEKTSKSQMSRK